MDVDMNVHEMKHNKQARQDIRLFAYLLLLASK
jgi:hypothetical protein